MRHHEQRDARARQVSLEPLYRRYVKVVGGLVEYHQIRLAQQQTRYGHTFHLSARQMVYPQRQVVDAELRQHLAHAVLVAPLVVMLLGYHGEQIVHQ